MSDTLLANLNPEQLAAVTLPDQPALILAGAGSGKTRVLTTRIAWLIQTGRVSPQGVLAVTFTNKAAKEMLTRLSAMLPINVRGMWLGTFHGLCNRFLRLHHRDAGLPQTFQILDTQDQQSAIKRLMKANGVDDEKYPPKQVGWFINNCKESGLRPGDVEVNDEFNRKYVQLYQLYQDQCEREGVVDFAELLLRTYEVLLKNIPLRTHYQHRFSHILIDEFQDTNTLQYAWLRLLAGQGEYMSDIDRTRAAESKRIAVANIFAVGDDDQSIYAFRGANVGNMDSLVRDFQVRNLIKLEQNYRSHGHILNSANALIKNNAKRLGKELWTDAGVGEQVRVFEAPSDLAEAQFVLEEVGGLTRDGWPRSQCAILYRSNAQSRAFEQGLMRHGIPYRVYGGLRFFERAEIKHALAYLRLMENPHDDTAFARVVNLPTRGIGARSVEQLQDMARERGTSLYGAVAFLAGKAGTSIGAFVKLIDGMRFATQGLPLHEIVEHIIDASGLLAMYRADKEGEERIENLEELVNAARNFNAEEGYALDAPATQAEAENELPSPLAAFLSHASLEAGDNQAQAGEDAVQLMTVHAAKGLEFDAVFLTGLEEGLFPHENSLKEDGGIEEERRLMYVAITRARKRLYISFCASRMMHGQTRYGLKSRFFDELPEEALRWLTPKISGMGTGFSAGMRDAWQRGGGKPFGDADYGGGAVPAFAKPQTSHGWRLGQGVRHPKFGEGVIVNLEGAGNDARAQINFGEAGMKWLALSVARLERV
ncbi:UvrD-helicase domain-containing protein [Piscinibacterium candidicorallinum]|uniref:DNA 3'-5' helicase n=1 Tax=Piscinibacterium candidicorallinum TaxID=1793872 RepID=A0ABV7H4Y7_9BURK